MLPNIFFSKNPSSPLLLIFLPVSSSLNLFSFSYFLAPYSLLLLKIYKIPLDPLISKIIDKLKESFPDSNFIQETNDGNKCRKYRLSW